MAKTPKTEVKPSSRSITDFFKRIPNQSSSSIASNSSSPVPSPRGSSSKNKLIKIKEKQQSPVKPLIKSNNALSQASTSKMNDNEVINSFEAEQSRIESLLEAEEELQENNNANLIDNSSTSLNSQIVLDKECTPSFLITSPIKPVVERSMTPIIVATEVKSITPSSSISISKQQNQLQTPAGSSSPIIPIISTPIDTLDKGKGREIIANEIEGEGDAEEEEAEIESLLIIATPIRQSTPNHSSLINGNISPSTSKSPVSPSIHTITTPLVKSTESTSTSPQTRSSKRLNPITPLKIVVAPSSQRSDYFTHSPSGSPLSSLPPSPVKGSLDDSPRKRYRRQHTFSLEIEVVDRSKRNSNHLTKPSTSKGEPRASKRSNVKMEVDAEDDLMEEEEVEEEEEEVGNETQIVEDSEGEQIDRNKRRKKSKSPITSDSDSDDEELMQALARAAARRAAGTTIITPSSTTTAATSILPTPTSPEIRRSDRVIAVSKEKEVVAVAAKLNTSGGGKLGINALVKENATRGTISAYEQAKLLLKADDDSDLLNSDDNSDFEREVTPLHTLSDNKLDSLIDVAARAVDDDEYVRSPEKREARERANHMAAFIKEDVNRAKEKVKLDPNEMERKFWNDNVKVTVLDNELIIGEGWKAITLKAIEAGQKDVNQFPTPILVCSRLSMTGSTRDEKDVAKTLLSLICHPSTSVTLANKANQLLNRLIINFAKTQPTILFDSILSLSDLKSELTKLGSKKEFINDLKSDDSMEVDQPEEEVDEDEWQATLSCELRTRSIVRWMRIVKDLVDTSPVEATSIISLIDLCVRLAIDVEASSTRSAIEQTLQSLISHPDVETSEARSNIVVTLMNAFKNANPKTKLEILRTLPHQNSTGKVLRKWLATAMLTPSIDVDAIIGDVSLFAGPPSLELVKAIVETPIEGSPFHIHSNMDDINLYNNTLILTIALTDLSGELYQISNKKRNEAIRNVDDLFSALSGVDGRIRTNVKSGNPERNRAKNALLRLCHSLNYQCKVADSKSTFKSNSESLDTVTTSITVNGNGKKSKIGSAESGQLKLGFAVVQKPEGELKKVVDTEIVEVEKLVEMEVEIENKE